MATTNINLRDPFGVITITFPERQVKLYSNQQLVLEAYEKTKHFHRPIVFDFCPGKRRMPYGQWWVPEGKSSQACTICEYCYNNKCLGEVKLVPYYHPNFNLSSNYIGNIPPDQLNDGNCDCDCPKSKDHPQPQNLQCPPCRIKSSEIFGSLTSIGVCKQCTNWTSYLETTYCPSCSYLLKACHKCGETIKEGNSYINAILVVFAKMIKRNRRCQIEFQDDPDEAAYYKNRVEKLEKQREEAITQLKNRLTEQMLVMSKQ